MPNNLKIVIVGLGYVGLPLAVGLARHFPVIGFDASSRRVSELRKGQDRTREIEPEVLRATPMHFSSEISEIAAADVYIIAVPTPVGEDRSPDLTAVKRACETVGKSMSKGAVVVLESTVYPGVTEDICGPVMEQVSGMRCGIDFFLGYSPERVNPGDREHTIDRITKVISGQTPETTKILEKVYGALTNGNIFVASSIKTAEAAKVIENAQRDINIAFVNEVAQIFAKLGISVHDVLAAAGTKWNFLKFQPGLVGGHCIGVDPFYLADVALRNGHNPEIILAGRRINDGMGPFVADQIDQRLKLVGKAKADILVLGLTFKENVPDLRNSKVVDVIARLREHGHQVVVHDAFADPEEAQEEFGIDLLPSIDTTSKFDCLLGAVPHDVYQGFSTETFSQMLRPGGLVADLKGMWIGKALPEGIDRWQL